MNRFKILLCFVLMIDFSLCCNYIRLQPPKKDVTWYHCLFGNRALYCPQRTGENPVKKIRQGRIELGLNQSISRVQDNFLSVAIGANEIKENWRKFNFSSKQLKTLAASLSPAILRVGGTDQDFLIFSKLEKFDTIKYASKMDSTLDKKYSNFTMTEFDWNNLNQFVKEANWTLLFGLNVLLRNKESWDSNNAEQLLNYNRQKGYQVDWELGNEPNHFVNKFNITISSSQLAHDFQTLRGLIDQNGFSNSLLVGPDVTRPKIPTTHEDGMASVDFLRGFLKSDSNVINATTFHQYYLDGKNTSQKDFLDPTVFDVLLQQITEIKQVVDQCQPGLPIWLGETGSAYGGGAPGLSNTFIAGFLWMDKLGLSSKNGVSVVIRQTLTGGNYQMVEKNDTDSSYLPLPDCWLSLLYKRLVANQVLDVNVTLKKTEKKQRIRFYAHCTKPGTYKQGSVTIYGMSLHKKTNTSLQLPPEIAGKTMDQYLFTPHLNNLKSKEVNLNGKMLQMLDSGELPALSPHRVNSSDSLIIPPRSYAFYVFPQANAKACL